MTKGQKRIAKIPTHIHAEKLPIGTWWDKTGNGKWMIKSKDDETGKWRSQRLCSGTSTLAEIWQAFEAYKAPSKLTFASLSKEFQTTPMWRKLVPSTQRDYLYCHEYITTIKINTGLLGDLPLSQWTIGLVRKYRDKRGESSESRANKELAYIKRVFSWAYEYEYEKIKANPTLGVKRLSSKPRQHYAEDKDYQFMLAHARESNYWYAPIYMEIAYMCRMRLSEVLDLTDADELPIGLMIRRRKGSKNNITEWNDRLRAAWQTAINTRNKILKQHKQPHPIKASDRFVFISERTGDRIQINSLKTAIGRIATETKKSADEQKIEWIRFTFHDLKRKGVSDTEGDKQKASGHRNSSMMKIYDVSIDTGKPAGK